MVNGEKIAVGGIVTNRDLVLVRVLSTRGGPGIAGAVLSALGNRGINLSCVVSFTDIQGRGNISFALVHDDLDQTMGLLSDCREEIEAEAIEFKRACSSLSIYGPHFSERPAIAGKMFDTIAAAGVDVHLISTSFSTVACIVDEAQLPAAEKALQETFLVP